MATKEWKTVGDYATLQRGTTYSGALVGEPGPALLGLGSIEPGGGFRAGHYKSFGGECPPKLMVAPGEVYVALKGATKDGSMVGSVARLPNDVPSGRLTQDTARLDFVERAPEVVSHLYWILRTPEYRNYCAERLTGSAAASFSRDDFLTYPIPPITSDSSAVVGLLDALEGKRAVIRTMAVTLEAMARTLFNSWFVDFDPVHAKAGGREPGLPSTVANLLPDAFEESELGSIPKGWEVRSLDQLGTFLNGLALQKYPPTADGWLPVIKISQLRSGDTRDADRAGTNLPAEYVVEDGDVLFSWSGSLECVLWAGGRGALNQHLFKVTSTTHPKWLCFLGVHRHLAEFRHIAAGKATTMGHIQRHHLSEAKLAVPSERVLQGFDALIAPVVEQSWRLRVQSRTLADLRDALLQRLSSGELRLKRDGRVAENRV